MTEHLRNLLRHAQMQSIEMFQGLKERMWTGMTEIDLAQIAEAELRARGAEHFWAPTLVSFGRNTVNCHPDFVPSDNHLRSADIVLMDVGPVVGGVLGDYCETFLWGEAAVFGEVVRDAKDLQEFAIAQIEPGMPARELYRVCASWIDDHGYVLRDLLGNIGHSIGVAFATEGFIDKYNEAPIIGAWTLEPHIAMGPRTSRAEAAKYATRAAGEDLGVFGAKFEDIVFVDQGGVELLR